MKHNLKKTFYNEKNIDESILKNDLKMMEKNIKKNKFYKISMQISII